ncbi:MAG: murB [Moraxellaceae bacterium]|jgi:UDP-N-acetylmuramate dehydrogenase|nr:murB [Moraxellaceae bacterium]
MRFIENQPLDRLNTFGITARARFYAAPESEVELARFLRSVTARNLPLMVLGGGSNLIFSGDFPGVVLQPALTGVACIGESADHYLVEAAGGEKWHDFVQYTLACHWYGLENLSLIPGTVGASPIQNIGAYGVEIADHLHSLTAMEIASGEVREFSREECRLGYRESVFKQELRGRYIITRVRFLLLKAAAVRTGYGDIRQELADHGIVQPTPRQVADAVIAIRTRKLPLPSVLGNAGSFFKNPVVAAGKLESLRQHFPEIVAYPQGEQAKLAAGWLIEKAGWKGRRIGPVGSYNKQALVLVNHGGATGADVMQVAHAIQQAVLQMFGVQLEMEPQVYGPD